MDPILRSNSPAIRKAWFPLICTLIVLISTAVEFESIYGDFVIDDHGVISDVGARGCDDNPLDCFKHPLFHTYYRPMVSVTFAIVKRFHLHGASADWFHIENLVFHAATVALGLWLFRLLLRRRTSALIAGSLFALHPSQVVATAFISGRSVTLSILFAFVFAIGLKRGSTLLRVWSRTRSVRHRALAYLWLLLSLLGFAAALFTREQVIGLVLLTPLLAGCGTRRTERRSGSKERGTGGKPCSGWAWLSLYLMPTAVYGIACKIVLTSVHLPRIDWSFRLHVEMVGRTIWYFVVALLFPTVSTLHQGTLDAWDVPQPVVSLLGYACAAVWLLLLACVHRSRIQLIMGLWFVVTVLPCLNLYPDSSMFVAPFRVPLPLFALPPRGKHSGSPKSCPSNRSTAI